MEYKFINFFLENYLEEISNFMGQELTIESDIVKESFYKWKESKNQKSKKEKLVKKDNVNKEDKSNKLSKVDKVSKSNKTNESDNETKLIGNKKGICQFIDEKNNQKCGAKIRGGLGDVCSKHKNKKNDPENSAVCIQRDPKTKTWVVLGTNLVVDGPENRQVVGMRLNNKIVKLNQEAIKDCKKYKLEYKNIE